MFLYTCTTLGSLSGFVMTKFTFLWMKINIYFISGALRSSQTCDTTAAAIFFCCSQFSAACMKHRLANSDSLHIPAVCLGTGGCGGEGGGLEVNYRQQRGHRAYYSGAGTCNGPMGMTFTTRARPHPSIAIHTHTATVCTPSLTFILKQRQWDR